MVIETDWDVIGPRLKKLAADHGSQIELAEKAGLSVSTLQKMLTGNNEPSFGKVVRLAEVLGVTMNEVIYGMNAESGDAGTPLELARQDGRLVEIQYLQDLEASAGNGAVVFDQLPEVSLSFRKDWVDKRAGSALDLRALRVRGDSMEPTLKSGDVIVVDLASANATDGLFVLNIGDDLLVKRLQRLSPTRLVIASDNPLAGSSEIDLRDESQHPRIIGRVIWLGRDL